MNFDPKEFLFHTETEDGIGYVSLVDMMGVHPALKTVNAARASYAKSTDEFTEKDAKLVKFLYEHGHFSTYRHSYFTFLLKAPLFVMRQWWKYQVGSAWENSNEVGEVASNITIPETNWNETSGRYVTMKPEFYFPNIVRKKSPSNKQGSLLESVGDVKYADELIPAIHLMKVQCEDQYRAYETLLGSGAAPEVCRMILPQNVYTECMWTVSLQSIIHFLNQRLKADAQYEIREYAYIIYAGMKELLKDLYYLPESPDYDWVREREGK